MKTNARAIVAAMAEYMTDLAWCQSVIEKGKNAEPILGFLEGDVRELQRLAKAENLDDVLDLLIATAKNL